MSDCSSDEAESIDWERQSGLESSRDVDLGYISERDSITAPQSKIEPAFTVIDVNDLETVQASSPSFSRASTIILLVCRAYMVFVTRQTGVWKPSLYFRELEVRHSRAG